MKIGEVKRLSDVLLENDENGEEEIKANLGPKYDMKNFSLMDLDDDLYSADQGLLGKQGYN